MNRSLKLTILFFVYSISSLYNEGFCQSVLSEGEIFKISVPESGIYSMDANFLSNELGKNLADIDPERIQIFTAGGGILPRENDIERFNDPIEIPILVIGQGDGNFDNTDKVYFYAPGPEQIALDSEFPQKQLNIYDLNNYLFVKFNEGIGKRITDRNSVSDPAIVYEHIHKLHRHELDKENLLGSFTSTEGSGQQWFGEAFANEWEQNFSSFFNKVNPIPGSLSQFHSVFVGRSDNTSKVQYTVDGEEILKNISGTDIGDVLDPYAYSTTIRQDIDISSSPQIKIEYLPNEQSDKAWLDFIQIISEENIAYTNNEWIFQLESNQQSSAAIQFDESQGYQLWDVTNFNEVVNCEIKNGQHGYNTNNLVRSFRLFSTNGSTPSPSYVGLVENQDIKSLGELEYLIIYHQDFIDAAQLLKDHRTTIDPLRIELVEVSKIYNEFSSGRMDPTAIRDFAKFLHDKYDSFRYLLLLGDASYDYRGIVPDLPFGNYVPTYQTRESLDPVNGFPYDDYFALLSAGEGGNFVGALDLSVGRIPVNRASDALDVINKIIHYDTSPKSLGAWKLNVGFAADDEDNNRHITDTDEIAEMVNANDSIFNIQKVYFDAFVQESTPGGERYPEAKAKIEENITKGELILNYLGHGGPRGWAQERVLQADDIRDWDNFDRLPIIITATCSFTGFDDPDLITAGEEAILNPNGGAVALFTTTRAVYASENARLTESVFENIFDKENGDYMRIGEIMRRGKNTGVDSLSSNARKFALIGDPTMRLGAPQHNVILDEINGVDVLTGEIDTLRALQEVTLKGHIANDAGQTQSGFNGKVFISLFDKPAIAKTLANNSQFSQVKEFKIQNNILFRGSATLVAGQFEIDLLIPKEINFNYGYGKISMYATDGIDQEAGGVFNTVVVGGTNQSNITDDVGPEVDIYMNDESFVNGGITNISPILYIKLEDDFGINISSTSIGHDITGVLDDDESKVIKLNDWYESTTDDFRSGTVQYPFGDLEPGLHKIRIKAWDICNNSTEKELEFRVVDKDHLTLEHVLNYPNPFTTSTNFSFEHQLPGSMLDVTVAIYTLSGKLVKSITESHFAEGFRMDEVFWDGTDDFGSRLAKGVYLYKIKVRDQMAEIQMESDFEKLLILK